MTLWISSLEERDRALSLSKARVLVSLTSPDSALPRPPSGLSASLHLRFHDIAQRDPNFVPFNASILSLLFSFVDEYKDEAILIHCFAGISRSTAAAFCLKAREAPDQEQGLAQDLRRLSPGATPNPLMIEIADSCLNRAGRMVEAVHSIGRGAESRLGNIFCW